MEAISPIHPPRLCFRIISDTVASKFLIDDRSKVFDLLMHRWFPRICSLYIPPSIRYGWIRDHAPVTRRDLPILITYTQITGCPTVASGRIPEPWLPDLPKQAVCTSSWWILLTCSFNSLGLSLKANHDKCIIKRKLGCFLIKISVNYVDLNSREKWRTVTYKKNTLQL